ncbi:FAD-dependent oxidoreductase [Nocardia acidivorans]|uniref:FAD-dependent oxidoreductase n=1 Tax=Nocardia acidivorans TaxID=404580 RepID=UPI000833638D|nr:FAD-dependent oxidoreductase [Nocardia acidivorans]
MSENSEIFDLVVVGSGAAGMAAALTAAHHGLSVLIVEKASHWGGSTARSGGGVWIPGNSVLRGQAPADDIESARTYLKSITGEYGDAERIDTYIDRGAEALDFMMAHAPLELRWVPGYSDYYPEAPGGRAHGRSVEPKPFDAQRLGAELATLEPDYTLAPKNFVATQADFRQFHLGLRNPRAPFRVLRIGARWAKGQLLRRHLLARGQALSAMFRIGLRDANVPLRLNTSLVELLETDGRVTGVVVESAGVEHVFGYLAALDAARA